MQELKFQFSLGTLAIVVLCWIVTSSVRADELDRLVDRAVTASGLAEQLETLNQAILYAVPEDAFPNNKARSDAAAFLKANAGKDSLLSAVRTAILESVDRETLEAAARFYGSKPGRRVARAQSAALDIHVLKKIREGRKIVASLSESRTNLLRRIIAAQRVAKASAALLVQAMRGLVDGTLIGSTDSTGRAEQMRTKARVIEKQILANSEKTEETALIACAHTFRNVDAEDLSEFAEYEESEAGSRFRQAVQEGLERVVYRSAHTLGEYLTMQNEASRTRAPAGRTSPSHQLGLPR